LPRGYLKSQRKGENVSMKSKYLQHTGGLLLRCRYESSELGRYLRFMDGILFARRVDQIVGDIDMNTPTPAPVVDINQI
jgi:hypothetical protein